MEQNREKYRGMFEVKSQEKKIRQIREKDWSQEVEHMQVPNGTGPGVRREGNTLLVGVSYL